MTRKWAVIILCLAAVSVLFPACLMAGAADIPAIEVWRALSGGEVSRKVWRAIVCDIRVPMALCAMLSGMALAVSGLLMQTLFRNPLAGPSIMGISSGASLGVAIVVLAGAGAGLGALGGALAGAMAIMGVLLAMARRVSSGSMLLIVGVLIGYLASSAISLLSYFAPEHSVHAFVVWGLGNFTSVSPSDLALYCALIAGFIVWSVFYIKPLDALLLGERYAAASGVNLRATRTGILWLSGALAAIVTAWCGPIAFIGMAVPHMARLSLGTSRHAWLLPATILFGAVTGLLTAWLSVAPATSGVLPVNAITPMLGIPVILYIIIKGNRRTYD